MLMKLQHLNPVVVISLKETLRQEIHQEGKGEGVRGGEDINNPSNIS